MRKLDYGKKGGKAMTREELIDAIDKDIHKWSCPYPLNLINFNKKLVEYENEIYNQALDDFIQHAKDSKYQVEGVDITPAFIKTIEFLVEEVKRGEHE